MISGGVRGSALASVTLPRLFGYTFTTLSANPWPSGSGNVLGLRRAGWKTICRSGRSSPSRAQEGVGLEHVAREWPAPRDGILQQVPGAARRRTQRYAVRLAVLHLHDDAGCKMVVIVRADARQMMLDVDAVRLERRSVANPGEHQNLRRLNGAGRDHDLAASAHTLAFAADLDFDSRRAPVLDEDPRHERLREDFEVRARACGAQVGDRGRIAPAIADRALPRAVAFRVRTIEVVIALVAERAHRFEKRANHGVRSRDVRDFDRSIRAVIAASPGNAALLSERMK